MNWPTEPGGYLCEYDGEEQECLAFVDFTVVSYEVQHLILVMTTNGLRHTEGAGDSQFTGPRPTNFVRMARPSRGRKHYPSSGLAAAVDTLP